ncbi:DUF305 domain-containing protein [Actinomadura rudentiformis]|uniref:DUF305 domain-containing protein n=1 Tax=Actinomadura rudentiformis TaxID=359158 RepID=A0A6H9YR93_9ACTN|nr:DUF305 domain-containing protein [Actinomadura rudentiformis]KAB2345566.1 DUF305 domain-containing protein [Actinomadura rudentiformis]
MRQRIAVVATAMALAACGLAGCSGGDDKKPDTGQKATVLQPGRPGEPNKTAVIGPSPAKPPTDAEVRFVQMMIPHHQQAVEMSVLAPGQASSAQVKALADRIDKGQAGEISVMQSWLKSVGKSTAGTGTGGGHGGHGGKKDPHAGMPGMATPEQMTQLREAKGAAFDKLYLQLMIVHHQGALTMVKDVLDRGTNVTVQQMARDVQSTQLAEINRMKDLMEA